MQARLAQLARAGPRARLVDRGAGAAVEHRGARPAAARARRRAPASKKRPRSAKASATATSSPAPVAPSAISVARAGRLASSARRTARPAIAQRHRQRQGIDEPPDPLVERDRAPQLAAVGGDARRLDVGAVRDQVLDDVVGGRFHDRDPASVAMILGVLGGSGLYDFDGLVRPARGRGVDAVRRRRRRRSPAGGIGDDAARCSCPGTAAAIAIRRPRSTTARTCSR